MPFPLFLTTFCIVVNTSEQACGDGGVVDLNADLEDWPVQEVTDPAVKGHLPNCYYPNRQIGPD
jgi:hypothetical protein